MSPEKLVLSFPSNHRRGSDQQFSLASISKEEDSVPENMHVLERVTDLDINLFRGKSHAVLLPGRVPNPIIFEKVADWKLAHTAPARHFQIIRQALDFLNSQPEK